MSVQCRKLKVLIKNSTGHEVTKCVDVMLSVWRVLDLRRDPTWVKIRVEKEMSDVQIRQIGFYV
jgi:hypothetical protein